MLDTIVEHATANKSGKAAHTLASRRRLRRGERIGETTVQETTVLVDSKTNRPYYGKNIMVDGAEYIDSLISHPQVIRMVAVGKTILSEKLEEEAVCSACFGTGMVSHWSEIAYFEDRRACSRCEAGYRIDTKIADIIRLARLEDRLSRV